MRSTQRSPQPLEPPPGPPRAAAGRRARSRAPYQRLAVECARLNEAFNHWIVRRTPLVTVKSAMTLDGKIGTASGDSKWITGPLALAEGMKLREGADAILVGINTVLADDPSLTFRKGGKQKTKSRKTLRRVVLDSYARTPLRAKAVSDEFAAALTTIVVTRHAPKHRI